MCRLLRLAEPQNHRCCYCGHHMILATKQFRMRPRNAISRDHVIPRACDGKNADNLVAACAQCNHLRGDMDAIAFFNLLQRLFRRSPNLHARWHYVSRATLANLRIRFLLTHERYLRGLGKRHKEYAFRHMHFVTNYGHELRRAA